MNKLHKLALENLDKFLSSGNPDPELAYLTEEEVRSFPQFSNASDEEVQNIIDTLHDLALICYELHQKRKKQES